MISRGTRFFVVTFGIVLPVATLVIEATTRMCASAFFDPLPTAWHLFLAAFVPAAYLAAFLRLRKDAPPPPWLARAVGVAIGVASVYATFFVPLTPLAVVAIVFGGLGLLPLSPLLAVVAGLLVRRALRRVAAAHGLEAPRVAAAALAGVALMAGADIPRAVTRAGLYRAVSADEDARLQGVEWLRVLGNEQELLRHCYTQGGQPMDVFWLFWWWRAPVSPEDARRVFYQATGRPYNSVPPAAHFLPPSRFQDFDFDTDTEQGGDAVGAPLSRLILASSRIDGSVDADAALAYVEWTMEFRNDAPFAQEARAQIALPPGGAVTRATLWIDGEEREAAFGPRGQVRAAYKAVVQRRRDPLLVTTAGDDRVLVQCFPVPPSGGLMKIRLGITAPLDLESRQRGSLVLPHLTEWNFGRPKGLAHSVWIESERPLHGTHASLMAAPLPSGGHLLRGPVPESDGGSVSVFVERGGAPDTSWTVDDRTPAHEVVRQTLVDRPATTPSRLILVVDASRGMAPFAGEVERSLASLPTKVRTSIVLATDRPAMTDGARASVLEDASWRGGTDNLQALGLAWDEAVRDPGAVVVWVHAPQPIVIGSAEALRQRLERRPDGPPLVAVPVSRGPNRILEGLDGLASIHTLARHGGLEDDLERLFRSFAAPAPEIAREWRREPPNGARVEAERTSAHLVRLWARAEIAANGAHAATRPKAVELAVRYQLVTPVSGAVVLENQAQLAAAGLEPAAPTDVPTVPEPGTWAVIAVASATLARAAWRRRQEARPCVSR